MIIQIVVPILITLIIVGTWAHNKTIDVEIKYDTLIRKSAYKNLAKEYYRVVIKEKKMGILKHYWVQHEQFFHYPSNRDNYIHKYKKKV